MKFFVTIGILVVAICFASETDYKKALLDIEEVFPGTIESSPEVIKVVFDNGASLHLGNELTPTEAINQPLVDWTADDSAFYTLMVINPDAPSPDDPYMRDCLMWLVGNIPGKNIDAADVLAEYISPGPGRNRGINRFFYLLYKQAGKIEFDDKHVDKFTVDGRVNFSVKNFTEKYNLGPAVGVNYLSAFFDQQSLALYKQLNCCEELM